MATKRTNVHVSADLLPTVEQHRKELSTKVGFEVSFARAVDSLIRKGLLYNAAQPKKGAR